MRIHTLIAGIGLAIALWLDGVGALQAQTPAALAGQVTSAQEGAMEGVLVSAKKARRDHHHHGVERPRGPFQLPGLQTRARPICVAHPRGRLRARRAEDRLMCRPAARANADIKLRKTNNIAAQLTNAEWMASFPGTDQQKIGLVSCVVCHSLERIVKSSYDAEGFMQVVKRMGTLFESEHAAQAAASPGRAHPAIGSGGSGAGGPAALCRLREHD